MGGCIQGDTQRLFSRSLFSCVKNQIQLDALANEDGDDNNNNNEKINMRVLFRNIFCGRWMGPSRQILAFRSTCC